MSATNGVVSVNKVTKRLYVTHLDAIGPCLTVWGQLNQLVMEAVRTKMQKMQPNCYAIDATWQLERQVLLLRPSTLCLVKRAIQRDSSGTTSSADNNNDYELLRSRILSTSVSATAQPMLDVLVEFMDFGYTAVVTSYELFFPKQQHLLGNIPAQCSQFMVLGICKDDWKRDELDQIMRIIVKQTLDICIEMEFNNYKFITMKWNEFNFAEFLIHQRKMGAPIVNDLLRDSFRKYLEKQQTNNEQQENQISSFNVAGHSIGGNQAQLTYDKSNIHYCNNNNMQLNVKCSDKNNNNNCSTVPGSEQLISKRSLAERLQQYQYQPAQQQLLMQRPPVQPRMPNMVSNFHSIMQGINQQNNRIPFTGVPSSPADIGSVYRQPKTPSPGYLTSAAGNIRSALSPNVAPFHPSALRYQSTPSQPQAVSNGTRTVDAAPMKAAVLSPKRTPIRTAYATFRANKLTVGKTYDVCVSFVENGPCLFNVQLESAQAELTAMMTQIERLPLRGLSELPTIGSACIARYSEDGQLYRALIIDVQPQACKVGYIDYGNGEMVNFRDLYEIPAEVRDAKAYSVSFTLAGHRELEPIDESLKKAFKELVIYKNCKLKVMPPEGPPLVQYCQLYLQDKNILDVLKDIQKSRLVYPKALHLEDGDNVEIRYIDSPKHFYVQKVSNIMAFENLIDDMFLYYNKNQVVPNQLALGAPCIVKFDNDWYRAEVMRADDRAIVVRHVDFGYEQKVTKNLLSIIAEQHLTMPRQAVQCCLKGFENNEVIKEIATTQFEMLAEQSNRQRRTFTAKVFRIEPDGVNLVNLWTKDLNVMKKLYKLSMPFDQYLTLEKEELNSYDHGQRRQRAPRTAGSVGGGSGGGGSGGGASAAEMTPSIASSNDGSTPAVLCSGLSNKRNFANSMPLQVSPPESLIPQQSLKSLQSLKPPPQQQPHQAQRFNKNNSTNSIEWDMKSSVSSMEQRDSRSSSSEHKQAAAGRRHQQAPQQQQQRNGRQQSAQSLLNSSTTSNDCAAAERRTNGSGSKQRVAGEGGGSSGASSPRSQHNSNNSRQQNGDNRRHQQNSNTNSKSGNAPSSPHQNGKRSQNAPKGYSQPRHSPQQQQQHAGRSSDTQSDANEPAQQPQQLDFLPLDRPFASDPIATPTANEKVLISWWVSPHQFYVQLKRRMADYDRLMADMQLLYKRQTSQALALRIGSHIVARNRRDNALHRGCIVACNQMLRRYKVHCVDTGYEFMATAEDIWPVERRFAQLPEMAYACCFAGIISNYDHCEIIDCIEKYLPSNAQLRCDFQARSGNVYNVEVCVNGGPSMRKMLAADGIITEVCAELRLELLASQQVRATFIAIKDMLSFKIELHAGDKRLQLLCSYDDVRYVKSNPDLTQQFKRFYARKTCALNIKDVNEAKVLLVRPLLPLLKEDDRVVRICSQPIVLETFKVRVAHVESAHRLYAQLVVNEVALAQQLNDMYDYYEKNGSPLDSYEPNQFCAAKSADGDWYRARIVDRVASPPSSSSADDVCLVFYPDYGNTEQVPQTLLKRLAPQFYEKHNAFAVEVNLPLRTAQLEQKHQHHNRNKAAKRDVTIQSDADVVEELFRLTLDESGHGIVVVVKALEVRHNRLIADMLIDGKSIVDVLREKQLIKGRDLEFMRKVLDKEPPNRLEYIEMVDLTMEDEESGGDGDKRPGSNASNKSKSNASTPRKKKPLKTEEAKRIGGRKPTEVEKTPSEVAAAPPPQLPASVATVRAPPSPLVAVEAVAIPPQPVDMAPPATAVATVAEIAPAVVEPKPDEEEEEEAVVAPVDPYAHMEEAILSHCDNPAQFFIHSLSTLMELRKLQENLQIVASSLPPLMRVINGAHCISHYSVDKQWYRAQIMDAELMVIQFIDFGNTDCLTDTTDVKEMSVFPNIAPLCEAVALPIRPNGTADWVDAANGIFNDSYSKVLHYEYLTRADAHRKRSYIQLYIGGVNIAERLVQDGYARHLQLVSSGENCFISHMNSIGDFYIQYDKDAKTLELIELYLSNEQQLKPLEKFAFGKIVAALFPDDGQWYRAKLLRELPQDGGYEVLFIDYGNTSVSPACREIGDGVARSRSSLSQKCALDLPASCVAWSEAAEKKFAEFAALGETIFTVELREPSAEHAVVHLLVDGRNINEDLEPLCESRPIEPDLSVSFGGNTTLPMSVCEVGVEYAGFVSHVNTPLDFYVQLKKDMARLEDLTVSLNALGMDEIDTPVVGQLCAAVYHEDNNLYRARVLEVVSAATREYRVLFVDYGNEAISECVRLLPQDLLELQHFATHCRLEGNFGAGFSDDLNTMLETCAKFVRLEFVDHEADPAVVKLFAATWEGDIGEQLAALPPKMCLISHAVSPTHFYIQLKDHSAQIEQVEKLLLKVHALRQPTLLIADVGCNCIVYVAEDGCFNRACVLNVLGINTYEVFLIDYGHSIVVDVLREMPKELYDIPPLAIRCSLNGVPSTDGENEQLLKERFQALLEAHFGEFYEIIADEFDAQTDVHRVTLQIGYKDLAEQLAAAVEAAEVNSDAEQADALSLSTTPDLHDCTLIHTDSPSSFYLLLTADTGAVENITNQLLDAERDFPPLTEPFVGAICAAQFPDDMAYYRARIVRLLDGGETSRRQCEVHFLDFGNYASTDQLRVLPEHLRNIEPYGRHCTLDTQFGAWEKAATYHFLALHDSRFVETFQVEFLRRSTELNICRLFYQNKNVAIEVMQLLQSSKMPLQEVVGPAVNSCA